MRLTADGVRVLVASAGLFAAGLWLGWPVAELVAGAGVGAVGFAVVTAGRGLRVDVEREIYPERVVRGEPAVARLRVRNAGARRSGAFEAHDAAGERRLSVSVPTLGIGEVVQRTYRLPTDRRGRHVVGPLTLTRQDALGLVRTQVATGGTATLWVHPRSHTLKVGDVGVSRRFDGRTVDQRSRGSLVFHALREYAVGDDLRHVHWKSTARAGQLMVREHVDPDEPQAAVVLDTRTSSWVDASFEDAVEVAASVVLAFAGSGLRVRLVTGAGVEVGSTAGDPQSLLDAMSELNTDESPQRPLRTVIGTGANGGVLVVLTAAAGTAMLGEITRLQSRFGLVVVFDLGSGGPQPRAGGPMVVTERTASAAVAAWNAVVR